MSTEELMRKHYFPICDCPSLECHRSIPISWLIYEQIKQQYGDVVFIAVDCSSERKGELVEDRGRFQIWKENP